MDMLREHRGAPEAHPNQWNPEQVRVAWRPRINSLLGPGLDQGAAEWRLRGRPQQLAKQHHGADVGEIYGSEMRAAVPLGSASSDPN